MDSIDYWAGRIRELEANIVAARQRALEAPPCASFFVFFSSQKDAAIAAQTNLHPEDGNSFRVTEAPGPEEVLSPSLEPFMPTPTLHCLHPMGTILASRCNLGSY